jgi:hypothetical protein
MEVNTFIIARSEGLFQPPSVKNWIDYGLGGLKITRGAMGSFFALMC